ncbi:NAD(P)-dependent oxidoreductase [Lachnospiraceae bacterium ZAX-1]
MAKIGWIGLGNMGSPMSQNLVKAGNEVTVWNRTKAKADAAITAGAKWADTPKEATKDAEIVFTMISDGPTLHHVVLGSDGVLESLKAGQIVIDMSTVAPAESETVNEAIEAKGAKLLRCPVTGSTVLAQNATLGILVSGDEESFKKVSPVLEALGNKQFYLGNGEQARVLKLAINGMLASTMQLMAEAVVLCEKAGLDVAQACEVIAGSAVGSPLVGYKKAVISEGIYNPAFSVKMMCKDLDLAFDAAKQYGVPMPAAALTRQNLTGAIALGKGDRDFSVLTQVLEEACGVKR